MEKPQVRTQVMAGLSATMAMGSTGYHYGWSSPSLPKLQANDSDIFLTSDEGSWVVSFFVVGTMFGPLIAALLVDTLGRKWSLLMTAVPHTVAGILLAAARSYWWFIIARCIAGVGSGMTYIVLPMYLGEIINDDIRGAVGAVVSQMMNAGILLTYCVGPWVNRMGLAGLGIALPICFSSIFVWMPESPYFLMMKKRTERATESLRWLRGTKDVSGEIAKIERSIEFDRQNAGTFRDLLTVAGNRKALAIIVGVVIAQQASGIGAVLAYNGLIFRAAGSNLDPSIDVIIVGLVQVLSGILCVFTVDLTGRKPLLLGSTFGSIVFLGGVALYFQLDVAGINVDSISWLVLASMVGYIITYSIGLGTLVFVMLSELFAYNVKAAAGMTTATLGAVCEIAVAKLYQVVADAWGIQASFWGFAGITVFSAMFITLFVPETKLKSLQAIQEQFHKP
ncbi:facilitated trehalose transporter Tret1-like [Athalia rosae]|uniref:facilitated trehalose transporter Tret1-like n=1 Tax=Athalia rosae TaxID=37344 RepID=UPI002033404A|nr:facilitated trehalose transporter Tret1-like [Athalia rosae]